MSKPAFLTNNPGNGDTVAQGIRSHLKYLSGHTDTPRLCIATAYFNPGGFVQLADQLEDLIKRGGTVQLLLGAEPPTHAELGRVNPPPPKPADMFNRAVIHDRDHMGFDVEADAATKRFLTWLKHGLEHGQIEVKRWLGGFLHGKAFIVDNHHSVIAGSANFTRAGMTLNRELNLGAYDETTADSASAWFNELWEDEQSYEYGHDLLELYSERFEAFTPEQIYLRMLWEKFGNDQVAADAPLPSQSELTLTGFQRDGIIRARRILAEHYGVLICDGVGLGKTFTAGQLIEDTTSNRQRALVIAPKALRDGSWAVFKRETKLNFDVISYEDLTRWDKLKGEHKVSPMNDYSLIVVDEAHAFRNPDSNRAAKLRELLSGEPRKRVVLLTATPVNNSFTDLETLLEYFVLDDGAFRTAGVPSMVERFKSLRKTPTHNLNPTELFDILDAVSIRRTRSFVQAHYPDDTVFVNGEQQALTFPDPVVHRVDWDLTGSTAETFDALQHALACGDSVKTSATELVEGELSLARYQPSAWAVDPAERLGQTRQQEGNLAGFIRSGLLKRFESSHGAFSVTVGRLIEKHEQFIKAFDNGFVAHGKDLDHFSSPVLDTPVTAADEDADLVDVFAEDDRTERASLFDPALRDAVDHDLQILKHLKALHDACDPSHDTKLNAILDTLRATADANKENRDARKVVLFTTFADTVQYFHEKIQTEILNAPEDDPLRLYLDADTERLVAVTGGSSSNAHAAVTGFAPESSGSPTADDKYDLLLTTDVLAEGVNLQQACNIINVDLPWNPMKLVQRNGRVDRIGSAHTEVHLHCVFPAGLVDKFLKLEKILLDKVRIANAAFGTEGEVVPSADEKQITYTDADSINMAAVDAQADIVRKLADGDISFLIEPDPLSGEEFRATLRDELTDSQKRQELENLPLPAGVTVTSGKVATPLFIFCARVSDDDFGLFYRVVRSNTDEMSRDDLAALRWAAEFRDEDHRDSLNLRDAAYTAWESAAADIAESWNALRDPAAGKTERVQRDLQAWCREAAALDTVTADQKERFHKVANWLSFPYLSRKVKALRALRTELKEEDVVARAERVAAFVENEGMRVATRLPNDLQQIDSSGVTLVAWIAVGPHRSGREEDVTVDPVWAPPGGTPVLIGPEPTSNDTGVDT